MKSEYYLPSVFLFAVIIAFCTANSFAQTQKLTVGNLQGADYVGCGCAFQSLAEAKKPRSQKIVFWSEDEKTAILNINGKDTEFKLVKKGKRRESEKIGSRHSDEFTANGIKAKVDYLTTRVCLKGEEDCESTSYDVTITLMKGDLKKAVKTKGSCGC